MSFTQVKSTWTGPVFPATVIRVLSGDSVIVRGQPKNGPSLEKQLKLNNVMAPKLARRPTDAASAETKDEPFAWEAREFLRRKLVGKEILFVVDHKVSATGREYGRIYLGKYTSGENMAESLVAEGLAEVRDATSNRSQFERLQRLNALQDAAKSSGKGKWGPPEVLQQHVRHIKWTLSPNETPRNFVDSFEKKPIKAVIEHVCDGSTVRAFLLPSFHYVTIMMSGIKCPGLKMGQHGRLLTQDSERYAGMAKHFTEVRLLQKDVEIILEDVTNEGFLGTIVHPNGSIAEALLKEGYAKCVDSNIAVVSAGAEKYGQAEKIAKEKRLRVWNVNDRSRSRSRSRGNRRTGSRDKRRSNNRANDRNGRSGPRSRRSRDKSRDRRSRDPSPRFGRSRLRDRDSGRRFGSRSPLPPRRRTPSPGGITRGRVETSGRKLPGPERRDVMPLTARYSPPRDAPEAELSLEDRDARTVFVKQLSQGIRPRDLEEFFSSVGKVRDVWILTDCKTRRSRGIAYIEFWDLASVPLALGLAGQRLLGVPIIVQLLTESEEISLASAMLETTFQQQNSGPMKLYVGPLDFDITEDMLRGIFEPFGEIDQIELLEDPETNYSRGYGYITYHSSEDAKRAMEQLNGSELAGCPMEVGHDTEHTPDEADQSALDNDELDRTGIDLETTGVVKMEPDSAEGTGMSLPSSAEPILNMPQEPQIMQPAIQQPALAPIESQCFVLSNVFDPAQQTKPGWHHDVADAILEECNKHEPSGFVLRIFVDKDAKEGNVYVKCSSVSAAVESVNAFLSEPYCGRIITAEYIPINGSRTPLAVKRSMILMIFGLDGWCTYLRRLRIRV